MIVVGIASPKQGGKDMVANIVQSYLEERFVLCSIFRFADPLKDIVAIYFGWDREKLDNDANYKEMVDKEWGISPRQALQKIGTEMFRDGPLFTQFNINPWVDHMKKRIEAHRSNRLNYGLRLPFCILIPDVRFWDEMDMIKNLGGSLIFVDPRPRIEPDPEPHASELDMWEKEDDEWDVIIPSGGPMKETEQGAVKLAETIHSQLLRDAKEYSDD